MEDKCESTVRCNRNIIIIHYGINYFVCFLFLCHIYWVKSVFSFGLYIWVLWSCWCCSVYLNKIIFFCWRYFLLNSVLSVESPLLASWPLFMLILLHFSFTMLFSFWMPGEQRFVYYLQSFFSFKIQYYLLCFFVCSLEIQ